MQNQRHSYEQIEAATCRHFSIGREHLRSPCRDLRHMMPRWVVVHLARQFTALSYPQIGDRLCRDHSSVFHQERKARELLAKPEFSGHVAAVVERLKPPPPPPPPAQPSREMIVRDAWRAAAGNVPRHLAAGAI